MKELRSVWSSDHKSNWINLPLLKGFLQISRVEAQLDAHLSSSGHKARHPVLLLATNVTFIISKELCFKIPQAMYMLNS